MFDAFLIGDLDKNGVLSRNEFTKVISCALKIQCQKTFLTITWSEFFQLTVQSFAMFGAEVTDNQLKRVFTVLDKDKNGRLSFTEFFCNPSTKK